MQILGIKNYSGFGGLTFQRRLRADEEQDYKRTIDEAEKQLGMHNVAMIIHGSCFPSNGRDSQIGSPYGEDSKDFIKFIQLHGFNSVQLGPAGKITRQDISPYASKVFAKNHLFIALKALTSDEYTRILSPQTYKNVTIENHGQKNRNYNNTNFYEAFENYDIALGEAFSNFTRLVKNGVAKALELDQEFKTFKAKSGNTLIKDGLFKVLSNEYGTDDFSKWDNPLDRNLPQLVEQGDKAAIARYEQIKIRSGKKIERNNFIQFIADKQLRANAEYRKEIGFSYINDLLVGFANSDMWANQEAFLPNMRMGCEYGGDNGGPQFWDIPVLNPDKLFNSDGSLGVAGKLLKDKINVSLENFENLRIDHALGLVDPYIYDVNNHSIGGNISKLPDIDKNNEYRNILEKIVLPTFKEHDVKINEALWEDICPETPVFTNIYHNKLRLPGLTQLQWKRAEHSPKKNWALIGSHDSVPAAKMYRDNSWSKDYLAGFLNADPARSVEKESFKKELDNPHTLLSAKFAELFRATRNIQISFSDFFAIDKTYNLGGQTSKDNWKLRLNNNYQDTYYKALEDKNSDVVCMPEVLKTALQAKIDMTVAKNNDRNPERANHIREILHQNMKHLFDKLDKYSEILREKEDISAE